MARFLFIGIAVGNGSAGPVHLTSVDMNTEPPVIPSDCGKLRAILPGNPATASGEQSACPDASVVGANRDEAAFPGAASGERIFL